MAAQEYYNPANAQQRPSQPPQGPPGQQHPPPPTLQPPNPGPSLPYPISDAPPPYTAISGAQRPHSQPPPQNRVPQQNGGPQYQPYNPNQQNFDTHQYPPEKLLQRPSNLQNMSRPPDFASSQPHLPPPQQYPPPNPYPPPQQNGYPQPNGYFASAGPGLSQVHGSQPRPPRRSSTTGYPDGQYRRDSRSRSRSRDRKHRHNHNRPPVQRQKSSGVNTFLGAGGGAILGDLIFPGLGTIGGAILGGVGGHEYGKKRASSNPSRTHNRRSASYYEEDDGRRGRKY